MWEVSEDVLREVKGDVLVIFDCCDAGSLAALRSRGRAFEYLCACDKNQQTYEPGKNSFTAALTWALKALKSEPSFTTGHLLEKIKEYKWIPNRMRPVLFPRGDYIPENIWITSMRKVETPTMIRRHSSSAPEFRDENCHFVDFRVIFSRPLADKDGKVVAEMMGPLVRDRKLPLNARHVSFLEKGVCKPLRSRPRELWSRGTKHVIASQRFRRTVGTHDIKPNRKRELARSESDIEEQIARKRVESTVELDSEHVYQLPTTPSSEDPEPDTGRIPELRIDTAFESTLTVAESQRRSKFDSASQIKSLLRDLEKLKQNALQNPELQQALHSQIRIMLDHSEGMVGPE
jgi:hypothetical protein